MWKCKKCGEEVVMIETVNITSTYKITKNKKKRNLKTKMTEGWETGYICNNTNCENNEKYFNILEDIAEWEED